jgi:N6-L-threonylcarbamoyladenine synthase
MKILSIETSCDETAVSLLEAEGSIEDPKFKILGNSLFSQIDIHKEYGGVYPSLAKREHSKNLTPLLKKTLSESGIEYENLGEVTDKTLLETEKILERENDLWKNLKNYLEELEDKKPQIDLISVTEGPGLAPALWVGVSFAKALSKIWNIPILGVNHMKGHIASILFCENNMEEVKNQKLKIKSNKIEFPAVALLISGGHTEIVFINKWGEYKMIGQTLDDAVGEAFDKTARMLGLSYPGGVEISNLATKARNQNIPKNIILPRPMIKSGDLNFSFSGLKTAVLYTIEKINDLTEEIKMDIAREFEDAVTEVLIEKTKKALIESDAKTLIIGGGVISNTHIRETFIKMIDSDFTGVVLKLPEKNLSTDNSIMIAMAGYIEYLVNPEKVNTHIVASGNLKF